MTEMMTLDRVQDMVRADDEGKCDIVVARCDVRLMEGKLVAPAAPDASEMTLRPSIWATGQLTSRLGIPTAFFRRLPPDIQDPIFNHLVAKEPKTELPERPEKEEKWLMRCQGDTLRGVLSERYRKYDNIDLLASLTSALPPHLRIASCLINDTSLHLRIVNPTAAYSVTPGDDLLAGIHVINSEIGFHSIMICLVIHRLICSNGLIMLVDQKNLLTQRHSFVAGDKFNQSVTEAIESAANMASQALEQFAATIKWEIPSPNNSVKALGFKWGLSQQLQDGILRAMQNEFPRYSDTGFALINGITGVAQGKSPDERFDLERLAGSLLDDMSLRSFVTNPPPQVLEAAAHPKSLNRKVFDPFAGDPSYLSGVGSGRALAHLIG